MHEGTAFCPISHYAREALIQLGVDCADTCPFNDCAELQGLPAVLDNAVDAECLADEHEMLWFEGMRVGAQSKLHPLDDVQGGESADLVLLAQLCYLDNVLRRWNLAGGDAPRFDYLEQKAESSWIVVEKAARVLITPLTAQLLVQDLAQLSQGVL